MANEPPENGTLQNAPLAQQLIDGILSGLPREGELNFTNSLLPSDQSAVLNNDILEILSAIHPPHLNGTVDNESYAIEILDNPDSQIMTTRFSYEYNGTQLSVVVNISCPDNTDSVESIVCSCGDIEVAYANYNHDSDDFSVDYIPQLVSVDDIHNILNAIAERIGYISSQAEDQQLPGSCLERMDQLPEYYSINTDPSTTLARSILDETRRAGIQPEEVLLHTLGWTNGTAINELEAHDIVVATEWRSEMRATFANNLLFKHLAAILRGGQRSLITLVDEINPEWAAILSNVDIRESDLLYVVRLPDGRSSTLSEIQLSLLAQILHFQDLISERKHNGGLLQEGVEQC